MEKFRLMKMLLIIGAFNMTMVTAECSKEDHTYECRATDEEVQNLICSRCYPDGQVSPYICHCSLDPADLISDEENHAYLSCQDAYNHGETESGVYTIKPGHLHSFKVYCDMETDGGGWTVFQRRMDGSVDFYRDWSDYVEGFGNLSGEYWLGLHKLYELANQNMEVALRVELENFENETRYAIYWHFFIHGHSGEYRVIAEHYRGNAGNGMDHNNWRAFTTKDRDNDDYGHYQCGQYHHSGWWHGHCTFANLNGYYYTSGVKNQKGIFWYKWLGFQSLKSTVMMVRGRHND